MKNKFIKFLLLPLMILNFAGCSNEKTLNNKIIYNATVESSVDCGYRNSGLKLVTDKGNFYIEADNKKDVLEALSFSNDFVGKSNIDIIYTNEVIDLEVDETIPVVKSIILHKQDN